jgi:Tol biopolymer transport system component
MAVLVWCVVMAVGTPATAGEQRGGTTHRVSVGSDGGQPNDDCIQPTISGDGRLVAFYTYASNLVPGDTNGSLDTFLRARATGTTQHIAATGPRPDRSTSEPSLSADGRYVAFITGPARVPPGDPPRGGDVVVRDRSTGKLEVVSVSSTGAPADAISSLPVISADGRYVAFASAASNLVPGDINGVEDVFRRDLRGHTTTRVSVSTSGAQGDRYSFVPALSADGRYVAFYSYAATLVPGDTNEQPDVFVRDVRAGTTIRVSVSSRGVQGTEWSYGMAQSISADGRYVSFESPSPDLVRGDTNDAVDVFVRDVRAGITTRVSVSASGAQGSGNSYLGGISGNGGYVALTSDAANLVPRDTNGRADVFRRDLRRGTTTLVSVSSQGVQANGLSYDPAISVDGRHVAFISYASNLVPGDTNGKSDVFVRDLN